MTLHNSPDGVFHPVLTTAAISLAGLVLIAVIAVQTWLLVGQYDQGEDA